MPYVLLTAIIKVMTKKKNDSEKSMAEASCKTYSDQPEETDGHAKHGTAEVFLG